jgi:hypothetical protein
MKKRSTVLTLMLLAAACSTGGVSYVPPSSKTFQPYSTPPPVDTWACACELSCANGTQRTARVTTMRFRGDDPPDADGCRELGASHWKDACGSPEAGKCVRCAPWGLAPGAAP